ncbi:MAG: FliO/MopB family protein [Gaiellaceae bacterium]
MPASISGVGVGVDATEMQTEEDEPAPGGGSSGGTLVRMVVGLAIVLAVIYGVYWLLRTQRRSKGMLSDERIGVLATTTLAPNRTIHLIRVGDELLLVGAAENSISPLRSYTAEEAASLEQQFGGAVDGNFTPLEPSTASPVVERFAAGLRRRTMRE